MSLCEELLPKKICTPPPKPPRRRHSDQSTVFFSGSRVANRKKQATGNLSHHPKASIITVSGSESLPSNWISESSKNTMKERQNIKHVDHNSLKQTKLFSLVLPQENSSLERTLSPENKLSSNISELNCCSTPDQLCITKPHLELANHLLKKELSSLQNTKFTSESTNHLLKQNGDSVIHHRRHHSDPVLSNFNNPLPPVSYGHFKSSIFEVPPLNCCFKGSKYAAFTTNPLNSKEIKIQKEINEKLWQHLCLVQAKLDSLQGSVKGDDNEDPSFSELLLHVYKAQKEKDDILQDRLKAALELRNSAIQELEDVLQIVVRGFEGYKSCEDEYDRRYKELEQFFHELETVEHPADILHHQHILLAYLYHAKENKIQHLSHALRLAEEERDKVLFKAKKLEDEVSKLKSSYCAFHSDGDAIYEIVNQRDSALAELKSLQAQILSHHTGSYCEAQIHDMTDEVGNTVYVETTTDDVECLKAKLNNLTELFTSEVKKRQFAEGNCLRLQRMLNFLLEKVNGLNIGVPV